MRAEATRMRREVTWGVEVLWVNEVVWVNEVLWGADVNEVLWGVEKWNWGDRTGNI